MALEEILRKIQILKYLNSDELGVVEQKLLRKKFPEGTTIFKERIAGDDMFLIAKGKVEISIERNNAKLVLAELGENTFFGEMSLITERPRSATAITLTDCELYSLDRSNFRKILNEKPELAVKFLLALSEILCGRILSTNENLETYFLINKAIVDNEQFRRLYIHSHSRHE